MDSDLDPATYRPPFITETGGAVVDDCMICSIVMAEATHTLGEIVSGKNGKTLTEGQLKDLRLHLRASLPPIKHFGDLSYSDARDFVKTEWPFLPLVPFYDAAGQGRSWSEFVHDLQNGWVAALEGDPGNVPNIDSALRRWQKNHFKHIIYIDRVRANGDFFVMDPLANVKGYDGQWIPGDEVRQYTATSKVGDKEVVRAALFKRGAASRRLHAAEVAAKSANAVIAALKKNADAAAKAAEKANEGRVAAQARVQALTAQVTQLTADKQALSAANDTLTAQVTQLTADKQALSAANDTLTAQVTQLTADKQALSAANDTLTAQVTQLTADKQALSAANDTLTAQVTQLTADKQALSAANDTLTAQVTQLTADKQALSAANDTLTAQVQLLSKGN